MSRHKEGHHKRQKPTLAQYKPLIVVLSIIALAVAVTQILNGRFDAMNAMRWFMGLFFLLFGLFKLIDWKGFVDAFAEYDVVTKRWRGYGWLYPLFELSLAGLFISGAYVLEASIATLALMSVSSIGVIQAVTGKRSIRCACLGAVIKLPMSTVTIIEDIGMGLMALAMILATLYA